jgi:hypothetical protein
MQGCSIRARYAGCPSISVVMQTIFCAVQIFLRVVNRIAAHRTPRANVSGWRETVKQRKFMLNRRVAGMEYARSAIKTGV